MSHSIKELLEISLKDKLNWVPKEEHVKTASVKPGTFLGNIEKIAYRLETLNVTPPPAKEPTVLEKLTEHAALKQQLDNLSPEKKEKIRELVKKASMQTKEAKAGAILKGLGIGVPSAAVGAAGAIAYGAKKRKSLEEGMTLRQQRLAQEIYRNRRLGIVNRLLLGGMNKKKAA